MGKYGLVFFYCIEREKNNNNSTNKYIAQTTLKASRFLCDLSVEIFFIVFYMHTYTSKPAHANMTWCVTKCVCVCVCKL